MNTFILNSTNVESPDMKLNYRYYHNGYTIPSYLKSLL